MYDAVRSVNAHSEMAAIPSRTTVEKSRPPLKKLQNQHYSYCILPNGIRYSRFAHEEDTGTDKALQQLLTLAFGFTHSAASLSPSSIPPRSRHVPLADLRKVPQA